MTFPDKMYSTFYAESEDGERIVLESHTGYEAYYEAKRLDRERVGSDTVTIFRVRNPQPIGWGVRVGGKSIDESKRPFTPLFN